MRVVRPLAIIVALVRYYLRILRSRWYLRFPFLPLPPSKYLAWRFETAYGSNRPSWKVIVIDLWQFGGWIAESNEGDSVGLGL
jgi:hypothetical protein